jgi:transposase
MIRRGESTDVAWARIMPLLPRSNGRRGRSQLVPLLEALRVPWLRPGRPRSRPDRVIADKAYSHPSTRAELRRRRIATTIPSVLIGKPGAAAGNLASTATAATTGT